MESKEVLFPHEKFRKIQKELIRDVKETLSNKKNLIINAPTGIGKSASTIAPAIALALKNDLKVFFLTSRHTQHKIALETAKKIKQKYDLDFPVTSIIGKKWLCAMDGIQGLTSSDFSHYCKALKKENKCPFFKNMKSGNELSIEAQYAIEQLKIRTPLSPEKILSEMKHSRLCPYEISLLLSKQAKLIVSDYYYIFDKGIRNAFFNKIDAKLENSIIIVDEAHNLGERTKDLATVRISSFILIRAIQEARKYASINTISKLERLVMLIENNSNDLELGNEEKIIGKDFIVDGINDYSEFVKELNTLADNIRSKQRNSFIGSCAEFLEEWKKDKEGFVRIISKDFEKRGLLVSYRCLDPSIITSKIIDESHSTIAMSGTLTPTKMYKEILGFPKDTLELNFDNPFPEQNRLSLIIPKTTTKYSERSENQFKEIAEYCNNVLKHIPGNVIIFFPSYFLRNQVHQKLFLITDKNLLLEKPSMGRSEKEKLLEDFKNSKEKGACLMAVASGNFSEGINLPGDYLKGVIVVGVPLQKPDLETKELIQYYDKKFQKGWDYGYLNPAFNKVLQSAGRCIRSEKDRGVIVFIDKRYSTMNYFRLFPRSMKVKVTLLYENLIKDFF